VAKCPWHEDREPSLSVDREKGLYHCFGCGESGDVVTLVQKFRGVGFKEAVGYLRARTGTLPANGRAGRRMPGTSVAQPGPAAAAASRETELRFILDEVAARYASALLSHSEARAYLASRGLDRAELITGFKLGYCTGELGDSLNEVQKAELIKLGVLKASGGEHFKGCVVFPLLDDAGHVVGFYGRRIISNSGPSHLYLPGPHRGLFNREAAKVYREELLLTESVIDALSLIALGIPTSFPAMEWAASLRSTPSSCTMSG